MGEEKERIIRGFKWSDNPRLFRPFCTLCLKKSFLSFFLFRLGLFSEQDPIKGGTFLDTIAKTLESKMEYQEGERDLIILQHKFDVELKNGNKVHFATFSEGSNKKKTCSFSFLFDSNSNTSPPP